MDQYLFEFKIKIVGVDLELFIESLILGGFEEQAKEIKRQYIEELTDLEN